MENIKFLARILIILALASCNRDLLQQDMNNSNSTTTTIRKVQGDGIHDLLGWGYDATVDYLSSEKYNKLQVIDVDKLKLEQSGYFYKGQPNSNLSQIIAGNNAVDWSLDISSKFSGSTTVKTLTATMKQDVIFNSTVSSKYSYARYVKTISLQREKLYHSIDVLKNYLTPTFVISINTLSPSEVVNCYGTHVFTDITIGGKLEVNYKSYVNSSTKKIGVNSGVSAAVDKVFSLSADNSVGLSYKSSNLQAICNYHTLGGNPALALSGDISDGTTSQKINLDSWAATVSLSNSEIVDIGESSLIPIYEFVSDPVKKANLKIAVDNYISSMGASILPVVPLYRYCYKTNHFYTTNWNELGAGSSSSTNGWYYEGIQAYVCATQLPNTVPLYRFSKTKTIFLGPTYQDHYYTSNYNSGIVNGYAYEGIQCYVFSSPLNNTVPLYQYYKSSIYDHFYTTDYSELGAGASGYSLNGECCYVVNGLR